MNYRNMAGAVAALATLALAPAAQAALVYTFEGTVASGTDYTGLLGGPANQSLVGKTFTLTYIVDPTAPVFLHQPGTIYDALFLMQPSSAWTGIATIDGHQLDQGLAEFGAIYAGYKDEPGDYVSDMFFELGGTSPVGDGSGETYHSYSLIQFGSYTGNAVIPTPPSFASPFTYELQPGDYQDARFSIARDGGDFGLLEQQIVVVAELTRVSVVDTSAVAVPEPATWALMIGGFGAVGATLRRRKLAAA